MNFALEGTPPDPTKNARKRMIRDIIEWNQFSNECPMITAAPMQENIFEWHINMNATSGVLKDITIHLIATFPPDYPKQPPTIRLCSFFPHPNVFSKGYYHWNYEWKWCRDKRHYYICLDMLRRYEDESDLDRKVILDSYHGWSAAYSVTSVLLQLSSFLYEDKSSFHSSNTRKHIKGKKGMKIESQGFCCQKCGHSYKVPYPPLNPHRIKKSKQRKLKKRQYAQKQKEDALEYITQQIEGHNNDDDVDLDEKLQLQLLEGRYEESKQTQRLRNIQKQRNNCINGNMIKRCTKNMWLFLYDDVERLITAYLSLRDLMKLSTVSIYHQRLVQDTKLLQIHRFGCWYHRVDLSFHNELLKIRGRFHGWNEEAMLELKSKTNESNREVYNLTLGYGIIPTFYPGGTSFGSHIHYDDLKAMQQAQDALNMMDDIKNQSEGKQSRNRNVSVINIPKRFSRDALDFPLLKEVKATFDLLSSDAYLNHNIHTTAWNDQSFHSFLPIYINDNHGKRAMDCLEEFVLQSYSKHDANIHQFHPLMAIHLIANIMNSLVVHLMQKLDADNPQQLAKQGKFAYGVVTDAFNTAIKGAGYYEYERMDAVQKEKNSQVLNLHYSINVLESYFHFHHLLLGVYHKYYSILQPVIENKCRNFIKDSKYRMKEYVPNVGEMMVWLTLNHITWNEACTALLDEVFIRHVKWVLMECPELFKVSNKTSCIRLHKTFEHSTTSLRLFCFQYFFLKSCCNIGNVSPIDKLEEYNDNFGCPPASLPYELQKWCRKIYGVKDWIGFFDLIDIPSPSAQSLSKWLEYAVMESERRGYHKNCDVDLLLHLKKAHYQSPEKIFTPNHLNDEWCLCSGELNGIPQTETIQQNEGVFGASKKVIFADIIIMKYVGYRWDPKGTKKKYALRPYPKDLKEKVNRLMERLLQINSIRLIPNIRYKLIIANHTDYYMDQTKWVKHFNGVFEDRDYNEEDLAQKRELYLWDNDAKYHNNELENGYYMRSKYFKRVHKECSWNSKGYEWRASAQKYIIDLDIVEMEDKPLILPFTLLNTEGVGDVNLYLNQTVKSDDCIYYITLPQILQIHQMPWNEWILTPYSVNLEGLYNELSSIYQSFRDRRMLPIIAELFEQFKARNPNIAANAHASNIYKLFEEDCIRGRKNQIIRKHFKGGLVWYKPHYKIPNIYYHNELMSEYHCKQSRLHLKYSEAMYCGEIITFHKTQYKPKYIECFYEIKPRFPKYIPSDYIKEEWIATEDDMKQYTKDDDNNTQKHVAVNQYSVIAISDALICTVMAQRGYNLNISEILPFHAKHSEICPIQHCSVELKYIKERKKSTETGALDEMNSYLHIQRGNRMDKLGEPEIMQFAMNRKEITKYLMDKTLFKQSMDFIGERENTSNWDNYGCIYRDKKYSDYYAEARNALKFKLPPLEIPSFDPFQSISSFLYRDYDDADNLWPNFDPVSVQSYDSSTHRWFNAKIIKLQSMSVIVTYDEWDKFVFKEKISLMSNKLAPFNTYLIEDDKIGYIDHDKAPSHYTLKHYTEEYEAKEKKQRRFDDKFNLLNDEYYHKYFFEAVADNNIKIVRQLLSAGTADDNDNNETNKNVKWTAFDWNEDGDDDDDTNNRFIKLLKEDAITDTDWMKWMNRKIDVNMTDTVGRNPLFVCAYNGYWKMYKLLIQHHIDIDIVDLHGQTALDAANAGLLNANTDNKTKYIKRIINHLKENMKQCKEGYCIRPNNKQNMNNDHDDNKAISNDIIPGNKGRRYINNDETIWSSSLVYIGNLPWKMTEEEIKELVLKYCMKPSQVIKRRNYTLIRTREDLRTLNKKIKKINGIFFRGAMITVNLFEQRRNNDNKESTKPRSLTAVQNGNDDDNNENISMITPNSALFVNNFDVIPGIYDILNKMFTSFGDLMRDVTIGLDKFGDPFAKVLYFNLDDAMRAYKDGNALNGGMKVGLRTLRIQYSKFNPKPRYNREYDVAARKQYSTPKQLHKYPTPKQERNIRPKPHSIRPQQRPNKKCKQRKPIQIMNVNNGDVDDGWIVKSKKGKNKKMKKKKVWNKRM